MSLKSFFSKQILIKEKNLVFLFFLIGLVIGLVVYWLTGEFFSNTSIWGLIAGVGFTLYTLIYISNRPSPQFEPEARTREIPVSKVIDMQMMGALKDALATSINKESDNKDSEIFRTEDLIKFRERYILNYSQFLEYTPIFLELRSLEANYDAQIKRLINNSTINLFIGTLSTGLALLIIGQSIWEHQKFDQPVDLFAFYVPRVTTTIFVEIFSFFFLKLYRKNLDEIKYYQNEITNLNFRMSSLRSAIKLNDPATIAGVINSFASTERNGILKKDESTEKVEMAKIDSTSDGNILHSFSEMVKSIKK